MYTAGVYHKAGGKYTQLSLLAYTIGPTHDKLIFHLVLLPACVSAC